MPEIEACFISYVYFLSGNIPAHRLLSGYSAYVFFMLNCMSQQLFQFSGFMDIFRVHGHLLIRKESRWWSKNCCSAAHNMERPTR